MHSYEHLVKMNEGGKEKDGVEGEVCQQDPVELQHHRYVKAGNPSPTIMYVLRS